MRNKIILDLKSEIYSLKNNYSNSDFKLIEQNITNLIYITNKIENNVLSSTSSSTENSNDNIEINNLPILDYDDQRLKLENWNYDFFKVNDKNELIDDVLYMFTEIFNFDNLKIDLMSFYNCIVEISKKYNNNPYHNFQHAVTVTHFIFLIIKNTNIINILSQYKLFGLLFSGLVHDIDHPGTDNMFEINKKSFLALQYNDNSVLENHHCSTAFYIMQKEDIKLLKNLNNEDFSELRTIIIECIFATDIKNHSSIISLSKSSDILNNHILLCKLIIHGADLCGPLKSFNVYKNNIKRLHQEMFNQKNKEEQLSLKITKKIDLNNIQELITNEINFSSLFVKPLWTIITDLFPTLKLLLVEHDNNIKQLLLNNYSPSESDSDI